MYIYTFRCAKCNHVWHISVISSGAGGMATRCPSCGCGNVSKIKEEKVKD